MLARPIPTLKESDEIRFLTKVSIAQTSMGCLEWIAFKCPKNYGQFDIGGKLFRSHRVAYFLHHNEDPGNLMVCHHCDNPACCNPLHLYLGTAADNAHDMIRKGRNALNASFGEKNGKHTKPESTPSGEKHYRAKLKKVDVIAIRADPRSPSELASIYGVAKTTISDIRRYKTWTKV